MDRNEEQKRQIQNLKNLLLPQQLEKLNTYRSYIPEEIDRIDRLVNELYFHTQYEDHHIQTWNIYLKLTTLLNYAKKQGEKRFEEKKKKEVESLEPPIKDGEFNKMEDSQNQKESENQNQIKLEKAKNIKELTDAYFDHNHPARQKLFREMDLLEKKLKEDFRDAELCIPTKQVISEFIERFYDEIFDKTNNRS